MLQLLPLRFVAGTVLALTIVAALGATPASAATSPSTWASSVCGALDSWVSDISTASAKVAESKPKSTANVKQKLTKLVALAQRETSSLLADLKSAGRPEVKGGKQIAATLREGFAQVQRIISGAKKTLAKTSTKDPTAFLNATRSVQDALESGLEGVQAAFSAVRTADAAPLLAAFTANKRCQAVAA